MIIVIGGGGGGHRRPSVVSSVSSLSFLSSSSSSSRSLWIRSRASIDAQAPTTVMLGRHSFRNCDQPTVIVYIPVSAASSRCSKWMLWWSPLTGVGLMTR
jgi:hypothetical protein